MPVAVLIVAFPEGGPQPFVASAFYPTLAGVLLIAALMRPEQRVLRTGAMLYAAALLAAYLIPTAVGGNIDRLGALMAGPIAAACASARSPQGGTAAPARRACHELQQDARVDRACAELARVGADRLCAAADVLADQRADRQLRLGGV